MSSYLSIYVVPKRKTKDEPKKYVILTAYSRNTDIYQYFNDTISPAYAGNEDKYTSLTKDSVSAVLDSFKEDIDSANKRLVEYEKYANNNPDYINEIIELKEYIEDLQYWKDKTSFIQDLVGDIDYYDSGIEEVCCNVD